MKNTKEQIEEKQAQLSQRAGEQLHEKAENLSWDKGCDYDVAFERVCQQNPKLMLQYSGHSFDEEDFDDNSTDGQQYVANIPYAPTDEENFSDFVDVGIRETMQRLDSDDYDEAMKVFFSENPSIKDRYGS